MKKKLMSLLLVTALFTTVLTGCGDSKDNNKDTGNNTNESGAIQIDMYHS